MDKTESKKSKCVPLTHCRFIPLLFMASFASSPVSLLASQYVYERYARDNGLDPQNTSFQNTTVCLRFNTSDDSLQQQVQQESSQFSMYMSLSLTIPSVISMPFWGALSDIVGRKVPVVFAIIGNIARVVALIVTVALQWPLWVILVGEFIHGICGYHTGTMLYVASAYIADNCPAQSRTIEMVFADLWLTVGMTVGSLITGFTIKQVGFNNPTLGYILPLAIVCLVEFIMIIYSLIGIPKFGRNIPQQQTSITGQILSTVKTTTTKSYKILFGPSENRVELTIIAVIFLLVAFADSGSREYLSVYAMGYPLCWRAVQLSVFKAIQVALYGIAASGFSFLWKRMHWRLESLVALGLSSSVCEFVLFGIGTKTFFMYLGILLGMCFLLIYPASRAIGAVMIDDNNQGALMAGLGAMQNLAMLFGILIFNYIYKATLDIYEGMFFFIGAAMLLPCYPILWKLFSLRNKKKDQPLLSYIDNDSPEINDE